MAKCLRCGAESAWIQGRVPDEPQYDADAMADEIAALTEENAKLRAAIAALPAAGDERWEKLEAAACEVISEADYQHGRSPHCFTEALGDAINNLRRAISQPPQEAGDEPGI